MDLTPNYTTVRTAASDLEVALGELGRKWAEELVGYGTKKHWLDHSVVRADTGPPVLWVNEHMCEDEEDAQEMIKLFWKGQPLKVEKDSKGEGFNITPQAQRQASTDETPSEEDFPESELSEDEILEQNRIQDAKMYYEDNLKGIPEEEWTEDDHSAVEAYLENPD